MWVLKPNQFEINFKTKSEENKWKSGHALHGWENLRDAGQPS